MSSRLFWLVVRFPTLPESSEAVSAVLFEAGALGCEEKEGMFVGYFPDGDTAALRTAILQAAARIQQAGLPLPARKIVVERIPESDWHSQWHKHFAPVEIGTNLRIRPPWDESPPRKGRIDIVIDPGQAFGTGHHATTHLLLEEIAARAGRLPLRALDIGTGSGILAITHARLCPASRIIACDIDPEAMENAVHNSRNNGTLSRTLFFVGSIDALGSGARFPMIYANLQRQLVVHMLPRVVALLESGGEAFLSGLLDTEQPEICRTLAGFPLQIEDIRQREEWIAIAVRRLQGGAAHSSKRKAHTSG